MFRCDGSDVHGYEAEDVADEVAMSSRKLIGAYVCARFFIFNLLAQFLTKCFVFRYGHR